MILVGDCVAGETASNGGSTTLLPLNQQIDALFLMVVRGGWSRDVTDVTLATKVGVPSTAVLLIRILRY